jgi:hypothetical protein
LYSAGTRITATPSVPRRINVTSVQVSIDLRVTARLTERVRMVVIQGPGLLGQ